MLSRRALALKPSATLALAAKAKELAGQGHKVISLSVGEPDWDTFPAIKKAGIAAIEKGQTKYAPSNGNPDLRRVIAEATSRELGVTYDANDVTVTAGAKMSVFSALQMLCNPGDEVVIPAPYWVSYPTMAELADAKPVYVKCTAESRYKLTGELLQSVLTARSKVLILNSPSNPTGEVHTREELKAIAEVVKRHPHLVVLSDDIYNKLVFDGSGLAPHLLHVEPSLRDRVVVINGASKSFSMTGWRLGWALGPKPLVNAMTNYQSQSVSCASPFTQTATIEGFKSCAAEMKEAVQSLHRRCEMVFDRLQSIEGFKVEKPNGAFYFWPDVSGYFGRRYNGKTIEGSREFSEFLLEDQMVAVVPGIEFGMDGFLRLSFVTDESSMREALNRIESFVTKLS